MASAAPSRIRTSRSPKPAVEPSREAALRTIARILEDQMTDMGLSEEEKNAKTALFAAMVDEKVNAKKNLDATSGNIPSLA